jgi:Predicted aminopeptidases
MRKFLLSIIISIAIAHVAYGYVSRKTEENGMIPSSAVINEGCSHSSTDAIIPNNNNQTDSGFDIDSLVALANNDNQVINHLDVLSNRIGGRLIGSNAYDNAVQWSAGLLRKWGLEVDIQEVGELPVGFNRGYWHGRMLDDIDGMELHFATPSFTSGTKGVQRGHVLIEPKTQKEFNRIKSALKGAWVLIDGTNQGWPIRTSKKSMEDRAEFKRMYLDIVRQNDEINRENAEIRKKNSEIEKSNKDSKRKKKSLIAYKDNIKYPESEGMVPFYQEMIEAGVLGFIQRSSVPIRVLYDRENLYNLSFDSLPAVPDIKLESSQYDIIKNKVQERRYFQLEFDIRNNFRPGPVKYHNVIGVIKGSEYPDEYVVVGGHLDSFDVATGAVDCGSGASVALETARLIMKSGAKPKRTIIIALWAGEEFGLYGSKFWVENNTDKLEKISNYFNRDYAPLAATSLTVTESMYSDFETVFKPLEKLNYSIPCELKKREGEIPEFPSNSNGSDHAYFARNGVPTLSFSLDDYDGVNFNYGEIWHTERDNFDKVYIDGQKQAAAVTAIVVLGVANLPNLLSREGLYQKRKTDNSLNEIKHKQYLFNAIFLYVFLGRFWDVV